MHPRLAQARCHIQLASASQPASGSYRSPARSPPIKSSRLRFFLAAGSLGAAHVPAAGAAAGTLVCGGRERGWGLVGACWAAPYLATQCTGRQHLSRLL